MSDPLLGKQLGDYVIQELLGRGGMARVYKGYDERLQRFAAVKVINSDQAPVADQAEYAERFRREARAIARLHHPNIVGVFQFGEYETSYYMAMVFVEGQDLRQILKENAEHGEKTPYDEVVNIIRGISSALDYAHSRGVIHRDIKPSNIMLDNENRAILTDFGLALNLQEGTLGDTFGSAHYIAPEQAVSSAKAVPQSDLYSLGVCLYEMLAGKVPFDDPSAMSVALKHLNDAPPPPRQFNPDLPPAVERVILKCLDKDPNQRYESGALLTQALEHALFGEVSEETYQMPVVSPTDISRATAARVAAAPTPRTAVAADTKDLATDSEISKQNRVRSASRSTSTQDAISTVIGPAATSGKPVNEAASTAGSRSKLPIALLLALLLLGGGGLLIASGALRGSGTPTPNATSVAALSTGNATAAVAVIGTAASTTEPTAPATKLATVATAAATKATTAAPTASDTATKTATETASATQVPTEATTDAPIADATQAASDAGPLGSNTDPVSIIMTYDDYQFVLINGGNHAVNISKFNFVQKGSTDATTRSMDTLLWYVETSRYTPESLPPKFCFQVYRNDITLPTPVPEDCSVTPRNYRAAWAKVAEARRFWIAPADGSATTFQVFNADTLLATCEIAARRCEFKLG